MTKAETSAATTRMAKAFKRRIQNFVTGPKVNFNEPKKYDIMDGDGPPVTMDDIIGKDKDKMKIDPIDKNESIDKNMS